MSTHTPSSGSTNNPNRQMGNNRRGTPKQKGALRAKSGCYTCRIRRKKCDENPDANGQCETCVRLRLQCLGFGAKRPEWMREGKVVRELRERIKVFLAQNGMIKGHSASARIRQQQLTPSTSPTASTGIPNPLGSSNTEDSLMSGTSSVTLTSNRAQGRITSPPYSPSSVSSPEANESLLTNNLPILDLSEGRELPPRAPCHGPMRAQGTRRLRNGPDRVTSGTQFQHDSRADESLVISGAIISTGSDVMHSPSHALDVGHQSPVAGVPPRSLRPSNHHNNIQSQSGYAYMNVNPCHANQPPAGIAPFSPSPAHGVHPSHAISNRLNVQPFTPYLEYSPVPSNLPASPASSSSSLYSGTIRNVNYNTQFSLNPHDASRSYRKISETMPPGRSRILPSSSTSTSETDPFSPRSDVNMFLVNNTSAGVTPITPAMHIKSEPFDSPLIMDSGFNDTNPSHYQRGGLDINLNVPSYSNDDGLCTYGNAPSTSTLMCSSYGITTPTNVHDMPGMNYGHQIMHQTDEYVRVYKEDSGTNGAGQDYSMEPQLSPDSPTALNEYGLQGDMMLSYTAPSDIVHSPVAMHGGYNHSHEQGMHSIHGMHTENHSSWTDRDTQEQTVSAEQLTTQGSSVPLAQFRLIHENNDGSPLQPFPQVNNEFSGLGYELQPWRRSLFGDLYYPDEIVQDMAEVLPVSPNALMLYSGDPSMDAQPEILDPLSFASLLAPALPEDEELVNHYMRYVLPMQYFFMEKSIIERLQYHAQPTLQQNVFRNAICHVARVHQRRMREASSRTNPMGSSPTRSIDSATSSSTMSTLLSDDSQTRSILSSFAQPESDEYFENTRMELNTAVSQKNFSMDHALAGLQTVSSVLFAGGIGDWKPFLEVACLWVGVILQKADNGDMAGNLERLSELEQFFVHATMWFEVLASVTEIREPYFLRYYQELFGKKRIEGVEEVEENQDSFSMLKDWGCENTIFLALAEISALASWKEEQMQKGRLSNVELIRRGIAIEKTLDSQIGSERQGQRFGRPGPGRREERGPGTSVDYVNTEYGGILSNRDMQYGSINMLRGGGEGGCVNDAAYTSADTSDSGRYAQDNLVNRRRLSADIFRASARLYLHTVLSGDHPNVEEIAAGVGEVMEAVRRVPWSADTKTLHGSVVRSTVFPICLAGCMTNNKDERDMLQTVLEREGGGAGNCVEVLGVMKEVWRLRDEDMSREVKWREILRERRVSLLLV